MPAAPQVISPHDFPESPQVKAAMTHVEQRANSPLNPPRVLLFEPNLKVLHYLGRTLEERFAPCLLSTEEALMHALGEKGGAGKAGVKSESGEVLLFAYDGVERSAELLERVRRARPELPIVVLALAVEKPDYEVLARFAVADLVLKPLMENLQEALVKNLPAAPGDSGVQEFEIDATHSFVRSSQRMREIEAQAALVARTDIPVLILGESGTGKEILATYTHKLSLRSKRMFLKINCAAMPAELLESELFGYEEGAFTGANKSKQGKFEIANGGTIFLDEIGEMPAALQAKLLHVLQDGSYFRLGGRTALHADVRIVAATNVNIQQAFAAKTFREDLYYRLNGLSLILPPLRERLDELPALATYFIRKSSTRHGLAPQPLTPTLLEGLARYGWPGNLRELENVMTRLLILQDERAILQELRVGPGDVPEPAFLGLANLPGAAPNGLSGTADRGLKDLARAVKGDAESAVIASALERTGWNRKAAAQDLQISYKALLYKIKQYELLPRFPRSAA